MYTIGGGEEDRGEEDRGEDQEAAGEVLQVFGQRRLEGANFGHVFLRELWKCEKFVEVGKVMADMGINGFKGIADLLLNLGHSAWLFKSLFDHERPANEVSLWLAG